MALKIVITGSKGLLGKYLISTQPLDNNAPEGIIQPLYEVIPTDRKSLDVSSFENVLTYLFKVKPDIIIHCAANGDVDSVEENASGAVRSDLLGTLNLMEYCEQVNCKLITISSNAVYDGDNAPYTEDSPRNPINFYGKIKSLADDIIMKSKCDWMIVRPHMMYGWPNEGQRGNWVTKLIASEGKTLKLVDDYFVQPTYAKHVADFIWDSISNNNLWNEQVNISSAEYYSIFDFGEAIKEAFNLDVNLEAIKLDDLDIAPRGVDTTFEQNHFEYLEEGLKRMKNE